jgi:hypothetical protein
MELFKGAAGSKSALGQQAAVEYARMNFAENGTKYIAGGLQADSRDQIVAVVENRAPFAVSQIVLTPVRWMRALCQERPLGYRNPCHRSARRLTPVGAVTDDVRSRLRIRWIQCGR